MNERKLIDEIKLSLQQEVIAGYWNGKVFVSDDKKTYTNIISNSQPIGVGFIVPYEGRWLLVVGSSNSEGRKNIINSKRSRRKPLIEELVYPVITLFSIDQTFENSFEKETRWVYLGGNKPSNRLAVRNGEEIESIDIPFEINGNLVLSSKVRGFISGKNIYFNYKTDNSNIFLSIIENQKYLVSLDGVIGTPDNIHNGYVGMRYIGDGVWESPEYSVINAVETSTPGQFNVHPNFNTTLVTVVTIGNHTVVVNGEIENYSYNNTSIYAFSLSRIQHTREYQTWNGYYKDSIELTSVTVENNPFVGLYLSQTWIDKWDISLPVLNFKSAYFLQEFKANVTLSPGQPPFYDPSQYKVIFSPPIRIYTQEVNRIKLISKNSSTPEIEINSDDFIRVKSYTLESELTINSTFLTLFVEILNYSDIIENFQPNFMIGMPILFSRAIELDNYLIYGYISSATMNFLPSPDVLTISISITKKVKRPCSFQGLISNNGSFYSYYFKNNPQINFMCKQIFADAQPNLFKQYFASESVVRLDTLKGNKIYSVISPRKDLEGEILWQISNTVYVEIWKITEDGKILYSDLITANYNNLKESRFDFKNIYAHNYVL